jgi:hypothetical protein
MSNTMDFLIFRGEMMNTIKNMDPDELVDVLGLDTETLLDRLSSDIDNYIWQEYHDCIDMEEEDLFDDDTL